MNGYIPTKEEAARLSNIGAEYDGPVRDGVDTLTLPAITDLKEAWYGMQVDKKKYSIVLENETEDSVYLKIVKKQPQEKI